MGQMSLPTKSTHCTFQTNFTPCTTESRSNFHFHLVVKQVYGVRGSVSGPAWSYKKGPQKKRSCALNLNKHCLCCHGVHIICRESTHNQATYQSSANEDGRAIALDWICTPRGASERSKARVKAATPVHACFISACYVDMKHA